MPKWRPSLVSASVNFRFLILCALPSNFPVKAFPSAITGFQFAHGAVTCPTGVHSVTPLKSMSSSRLTQPSSFCHLSVDSPALTAAAKAIKSSADVMPGLSETTGSTGSSDAFLQQTSVRAAMARKRNENFFILVFSFNRYRTNYEAILRNRFIIFLGYN